MKVKACFLLLVGMLLASCSDGGDSATDAGEDVKKELDAGQDGEIGRDEDTGAIACTTLDPDCPKNLACLCCGSIGPQEQCLCTTACRDDSECGSADQPFCNKPNPTSDGVCTPEDYNCCWLCQ